MRNDMKVQYPEFATSMFEMLLDNTYDSFFVTDGEGYVLYVNPAACHFLDTPKEELIGHNVKQLVADKKYSTSVSLMAIEKKELVWEYCTTQSGRILINVSMPLLDDNGQVTLVITNAKEKDKIDTVIKKIDHERMLLNRYKSEVEYLRSKNMEREEIVYGSKIMDQILQKIRIVARFDSSVFLSGESGCGKGVVAKYIHKHNQNFTGAFVDVNCATIPENLMEAELFGYEKGAFTGASVHGKLGLIELADKGTLFLDEIAELPLPLQSKLLKVLETKEVRRIGSTKTKKVDFRLITATNKDLKQMVQNNLFRSDLYYRLNVIPIEIPPLRERLEDIAVLAQQFLEELNKKYGLCKFLAPQTVEALMQHSWPGNVRELRNVVERLFITSPDEQMIIHESSIIGEITVYEASLSKNAISVPLKELLKSTEERYIQLALEISKGNIESAASKLGIHRSALYKKLRKRSVT